MNSLLQMIANLLYKIAKKIESNIYVRHSSQFMRVVPWIKDKGDKTHRVDYDLNQDSIVFDLGGYEGQWASDIFCKYNCYIHIFEPVVTYSENIKKRFEKNNKVQVHSFGLASTNSSEKLSLSLDSSSIFGSGTNKIDIILVEAESFIHNSEIKFIDLMKINIEGAEYELLEYLIEEGIVSKINNIQVQFHDFVSDAESRMKSIQHNLRKTHYLTYHYEFVWENWKLKN